MESKDIFQMLSFSYGDGEYKRGRSFYKGQIVLSEHKLYLKDADGEIADTFIPLEKIYRIQIGFLGNTLWIYVRLSQFIQFEAKIKGVSKNIRPLLRDLVERRQLQRKGWHQEWVDPQMV